MSAKSLILNVCHLNGLVSCQLRRYYLASEQRLTVFAYLAYEGESGVTQAAIQISTVIRTINGALSGIRASSLRLRNHMCLDCILIEDQNDTNSGFLGPRKFFRVDSV